MVIFKNVKLFNSTPKTKSEPTILYTSFYNLKVNTTHTHTSPMPSYLNQIEPPPHPPYSLPGHTQSTSFNCTQPDSVDVTARFALIELCVCADGDKDDHHDDGPRRRKIQTIIIHTNMMRTLCATKSRYREREMSTAEHIPQANRK